MNVFKSKEGDSEKGSILLLVALSLTMFLGLGALVTDLGVIYAKYAHLQNSLDSAALAGVQELPNDTVQAQKIAEQYAKENGASQVTINFALNDLEINVWAQEQVPAFLSAIWGLKENTISTTAKAIMLPPTSLTGAVPLSIKEQDFIYGAEYCLKSGAGEDDNTDTNEGNDYSGWFGALELSGSGASDYQTDLTNGYSGTLNINQILDVKHGNMSGPTLKAITDRLATDTRLPHNTFNDYERNAPEIVYVPIVKTLSNPGNSINQVQIVGFAAFFLEGVIGNGNASTITGRFLRTIVVNGQAGGSLADLQQSETEMEQGKISSDFGLYAPKLLPS